MLAKQRISRVVYLLYRALLISIRAILAIITIAIHSSNHDADKLCDHAAAVTTTATANHGPTESPNDDHQRE